MLFWTSVAVVVVGAILCWIDEVAFDEDSSDIQWRRRVGLSRVGLTLIAAGALGITVDVTGLA